MQRPLEYMPLSFHRVRRPWKLISVLIVIDLILLAFAALAGAVVLTVGFSLFGAALLFSLSNYLWTGARWEYRLEGRTLSIRRLSDRDFATMQVDEIAELIEFQNGDDRFVEFIFTDRRRCFIESWTFASTDEFLRVLQQLRPELSLKWRKNYACNECGFLLGGMDSRRCFKCKAPIARQLPRVPAGGILLPQALDVPE
jgi:hypothetical protein